MGGGPETSHRHIIPPQLVKNVPPPPYIQGVPLIAAPMNIQPPVSQVMTRQNQENVFKPDHNLSSVLSQTHKTLLPGNSVRKHVQSTTTSNRLKQDSNPTLQSQPREMPVVSRHLNEKRNARSVAPHSFLYRTQPQRLLT